MYEARCAALSPARGSLIQIQLLKPLQKARVPPAAGTVLPWRLTSIRSAAQTHWNSVSSCWGLERVSHPSQPVASGLLPAPSHGSLKSRAHPGITILHQAPLGASTTLSFTDSFPAERQSVLPPPGRLRKWEVALPGCPSRLRSAAVKLAS